jgi:hypothetical protein
MPEISIHRIHNLGEDKAKELIDNYLVKLRANDKVKNFQWQWVFYTATISFEYSGVAVTGTITVDEFTVDVVGTIPLRYFYYRSEVEKEIRDGIDEALSQTKEGEADGKEKQSKK